MWDIATSQFNGGVKPNLSECIYVGDAAGRPKSGSHKKDFSCADYKFALNVGLSFHTPEAFFLGSKESIHVSPRSWSLGFDPRNLFESAKDTPLFQDGSNDAQAPHQELVVLVGPPASGKSTFSKEHLPTYCRINQDTLHSVEKCRKAVDEMLGQGKSVVVDNTNRYGLIL